MTQKNLVLLHGLPKPKDEPSASGYCQKVETFLRATSTPYELREIYPNKAPKGKVPFITVNNVPITDSHFILRHLIQTDLSPNLDRDLTRGQLADTRAYQTYIEELLYPCIVRERWFIDENYSVISKEAFGSIPWPIRSLVSWYFRRRAMNALWYQGVGRHSKEEVESIIKRAFEDLEAKYSHGENYFHCTENPTEIDIIVHAFIVNALQTNSNPFVSQQILTKPHLVKFALNMTNKLFPEYNKILRRLETKL
jgi:glutathione S-transferase